MTVNLPVLMSESECPFERRTMDWMRACNAVLIVFAGAAALGYVWPAMAGAALAVAVLLAILERRPRPAGPRSARV